jgi:hypothetical protein
MGRKIKIPEHDLTLVVIPDESTAKILKNLLLWDVQTDEEVDEIRKNFKGKMIKLNPKPNPFHKPKSEWTEEMKQQFKDFKLKYGFI